jgi:gluconokinase
VATLDHPVVVMGVSGSGKTAVGSALADALKVPFQDGDDLHPAANVDKMRRGLALDDADRRPWLEQVGRWLAAHAEGAVVACSALRRSYRDLLREHCAAVEFLHLSGDQDLIARRQSARRGHFMPPELLGSQIDSLEPLARDERGLVVDVELPVEAIVATYVARLDSPDQPSS